MLDLSYYSLLDVDIAIEKNKLIYPSHPAFNVSCYTIVCFVNRCLSFFFWPLCCLSFFDLLIMVTILSSNPSHTGSFYISNLARVL